MRLPRPRIHRCCIHVTHRCHQRQFLLNYDLDRKIYQARLFEASRRFRFVKILNYVITSNHIHILLWAPRMSDLSMMMQWLQGTTAGDLNRRQKREGSFWRGRFHATLIESGEHLSRCLFYIDMNMVRAGVVAHPQSWYFGGCRELLGFRKRYRVIDQNALISCLEMYNQERFYSWYSQTLNNICRTPKTKQVREPYWTSALAVGSPGWLEGLINNDAEAKTFIKGTEEAATNYPTSFLNVPQSIYLRLMKKWLRPNE